MWCQIDDREEREVSEIANYVRNIGNTDFSVNK